MSSSASLVAGIAVGFSVAAVSAANCQTQPTASFVTTVGADTISIEQYGRVGNTIRGVWASRNTSIGAQLFYYEIILDAGGRAAKYSVLVRPAGSTTPAAKLPSVEIQYGRDTAIFSMQGDPSMKKRIAMSGAYPRLGTSVVGIELALDRLRSSGVDASTIVVNSPLGPSFDPIRLPVLFVRADSVRMTKDLVARLDTAGQLVELHDSNRETRRVASVDVDAIVDGWSSSRGSETAGIQMSLSELQRFVGRYLLKPDLQIAIERIGNTLVLRSPDGSLDLVAQAATTFKVSGESGFVEFERTAAGDVTALVLVNGSTRQRAPRVK